MTDLATAPAEPAGASPVERRFGGRDLTTWIVWGLIALRVLAFLGLVLSHQDRVDGGLAGDIRRYEEMASASGVPYRDFQIEYPPVTYALIKLTYGGSLGVTITLVAISQLACDLLISFILRWIWSVRAQAAYLVLGAPLILWPFIYARIDLFTVLLVMGGFALMRRGRDAGAGAMFALAVLAKIWPFGVAPAMLVERRVKGLVSFCVTGFVGALGWLLLAGSASGVQQVVSFRDATGWQVESLPGILWHIKDPSRIKFESGAFRTGIMPLWARPTMTLISLLLVALAWWLAYRRRRDGASDIVTYATAPLAAVLALLLFSAILSPQYVVWILPFAAILAADRDRLIAGLTLATTCITTLTYIAVPGASEGALYGTLPVLVRNLLLVALFIVVIQDLCGVRREREA